MTFITKKIGPKFSAQQGGRGVGSWLNPRRYASVPDQREERKEIAVLKPREGIGLK